MNAVPITANECMVLLSLPGRSTVVPQRFLLPSNAPQSLDDDLTLAVSKLTDKVVPNVKKAAKIKPKKLSPDFEDSVYDYIRPSVASILKMSFKFEIKSSKAKGAVLVCGEDAPSAEESGFGISILPLKVGGKEPGVFEDNVLILALGRHAQAQYSDQQDAEPEATDLPELILGLCCNNWGMYNGRNALIEAILELLGPQHRFKLSIHSAVYALDFNTNALHQIILPCEQEAAAVEEELAVRTLHVEAFAASAEKYGLGFDSVEDRHLIAGVSKASFAEELSQASIQAVERTLSSITGRRAIDLVLEILKHRRLIQDNMKNKRFRRARSQNSIAGASKNLQEIFAAHLDVSELVLANQIPGWGAYTKANGGDAMAVLGLVCHSMDVLAGCVGRSTAKITPDIAERLVLTVMIKSNRLMEYTFNQVFELLQQEEPATTSRVYIYRRPGDLQIFSTMSCGVVEISGKL